MPNIGEIFEVTDFSGGKTDYPLESPPNTYEEADNFVVDITGKLLTRPGYNNVFTTAANCPFGGEISSNRQIILFKAFLDRIVAINKNKIASCDRAELPISGAVPTLPSSGFVEPSGAGHGIDKFPWADVWNGQFFWGGANSFGTPSYPKRLVKMATPVAGIRLINCGLQTPYRTITASAVRFTPSAAGSTYNYIYYLVLRYDYSIYPIEGVATAVEFVDLGAPYLPPDTTGVNSIRVGMSAAIGGANTITIDRLYSTFIAGLDNLDENYLKLDIYRTKANEQSAYLVTTINTIGTTILNNAYSYVDSMDDATLETKLPFYMNGGIVANGEPPQSRFGVIGNNIGWYGYTRDAYYDSGLESRALGPILTNRVRHSIIGDPDSCPPDFFVDVEGEITAMGQVEGVPIVFTRSRIFRLEGSRDIFGGGEVVAKVIAENVGTMFPYSIVSTPNSNGIYFAGIDGFYFTDGNKVIPISKNLKITYRSVNSSELDNRIQGTYDRVNNRVLWHFNIQYGSSIIYQTYVFHEEFGIKDNGVFTTWSYLQPDQSTQNISITTMYFEPFTKNLLIAANNTQLFFMSMTAPNYVDKYLYSPVTTAIDNYNFIDIIVTYKSAVFNFGTNKLRKWVSIIEIVAERAVSYLLDAAVGIQVSTDNDRKGVFSNLKVISWSYQTGLINVWRRLLKTKLRCLTKQVKFTNGKIVLQRSDDASTATISAASSISVDGISWSNSRSVLLDNTSFNWFSDAEEKVIAFDTDGYVNEYRILNLDTGSDTIIIRDPSLTASAGSGRKWVIRGYTSFPKLKSYALNYEVLGDTTKQYSVTKSSGNA